MRAALDFLRAPVFLCIRDEIALLGADRARVAGLGGALEAAEVGLHRAREQAVLSALALAA
jgi:hypothetical protein